MSMYRGYFVPNGKDPSGLGYISFTGGWGGANDPNPVLNFKYTVRTKNSCKNEPNDCPCPQRCKGKVTASLTFRATFNRQFGTRQDVFRHGTTYQLEACGKTSKITYEDANYPRTSGPTLNATIDCPIALNCCLDGFRDTAVIRSQTPGSLPTVTFRWGVSVKDCGRECFVAEVPKFGKGDTTGPHKWLFEKFSGGPKCIPTSVIVVSGIPNSPIRPGS